MPNFQTFNRNHAGDKGVPHVTVLRSGMLSLNKPAFLALGSPDAVELLYDEAEQVIGLRPVAAGADTAYIVRHPAHGNGGPFLITALAFTKYFDIDTTQSLRWDASVIAGVLCVRLTDTPVSVTATRPSASDGDDSTVVPLRRDA